MAYPHADNKHDLYMRLPKGIESAFGDGQVYVLKLLKNIYGQKQARRVWFLHLKKGLESIGFMSLEG
eukprot:6728136-Ditylum_brightwellii.AAC.1